MRNFIRAAKRATILRHINRTDSRSNIQENSLRFIIEEYTKILTHIRLKNRSLYRFV